MAQFTESNLHDSFVIKTKRLAKARQTALKLLREEKGMRKGDKESEEVQKMALECGKCSGDSEKSEIAHIDDLCPVEKKRISDLIEKLADCTREKYTAEDSLAILKSEKEALENRYTLFCNKSEDEKSQLKSQLANAMTEVKKLRVQTSESLDLLTRQIKTQEKQFYQLTVTTKSLVQEKSQLEKSLVEKEGQLRNAEAMMERVKENAELERLLLLKDCMQKLTIKTESRACQTQEVYETLSSTSLDSYSDTEILLRSDMKRKASLQKLRIVQQTKNKDDLEEHTTDNKIIHDLFFTKQNFNDNECLNLPLSSLMS